MNFESIVFKKEGNIGIITINRPQAMNALNSQVLTELDAAIEGVKKDKDIYVLLLTGEGKAFVAGADIGEMSSKTPEEAKSFAKKGMELFRKIEELTIPTIALVNGFALGGGCELAMSFDIRIASEKAKFGQPEVGLGITPGFGGTQRLPRLVGLAKAKELIFTCDMIGAVEALNIGLVNKITTLDELIKEGMAMADKIASKGQVAVRYSKEAINTGMQTDIDTAMDIEANLFGLCFANSDQKEGMSAFTEKRKPEFKN